MYFIPLFDFNVVRIDVPVFYEDTVGAHKTVGQHALLLPHEVVGSMYAFPHADLMKKLTGDAGVSWLRPHACFVFCSVLIPGLLH